MPCDWRAPAERCSRLEQEKCLTGDRMVVCTAVRDPREQLDARVGIRGHVATVVEGDRVAAERTAARV